MADQAPIQPSSVGRVIEQTWLPVLGLQLINWKAAADAKSQQKFECDDRGYPNRQSVATDRTRMILRTTADLPGSG